MFVYFKEKNKIYLQETFLNDTNLLWFDHTPGDQSPNDQGRRYSDHRIYIQSEPSVVPAQTYAVTLRLKLHPRCRRLLLDSLGSLHLGIWIHFTTYCFTTLL